MERIVKKYLLIILLVGVCFGQDAYPYFSDMSKQLEFEKKRIIIKEGESTQQIIRGGGSEFNLWSLVDDSEPTYKTAPIRTSYRYNSYFNIYRNGRSLSEIEMLRAIGLNDEADRITSEFEKELLLYVDTPNDTTLSDEFFTKLNFLNNFHIPLSALTLGVGLSLTSDSSEVENGVGTAIFGFCYLLWSLNSKYYLDAEDYLIIEKSKDEPILRQKLNNAQTKSMVEAYNRKLYSEIAKK